MLIGSLARCWMRNSLSICHSERSRRRSRRISITIEFSHVLKILQLRRNNLHYISLAFRQASIRYGVSPLPFEARFATTSNGHPKRYARNDTHGREPRLYGDSSTSLRMTHICEYLTCLKDPSLRSG